MDKALAVAQYFIRKNEQDKKGLSPLKIQKLLYYAQAWNLVFNKKKLFDDDIQAWIHGPVVPRVWETFNGFDFSAVQEEFLEKDFGELDDTEKGVLDMVWGIYGKYDGKYLEILTHSEDPWIQARQNLPEDIPSQNVISEDSLANYYGRRFEEAQRAQ